MRLLLDANVLFAACWSPEGRAATLIELSKLASIDLLASPHGIEEARRNLGIKRPAAANRLDSILGVIEVVDEAPAELVAWVSANHGLPLKDAPIFAAGLTGEADALVTGDLVHFGHLHDIPNLGLKVLRLRDAVALALGS